VELRATPPFHGVRKAPIQCREGTGPATAQSLSCFKKVVKLLSIHNAVAGAYRLLQRRATPRWSLAPVLSGGLSLCHHKEERPSTDTVWRKSIVAGGRHKRAFARCSFCGFGGVVSSLPPRGRSLSTPHQG
jgi:hypothetical protein